MHFANLSDFLAKGSDVLAKGPVALVFAEDEVELASTIRHHRVSGFAQTVVFMPPEFGLSPELAHLICRVDYDTAQEHALENAVNAVIDAAPGVWLYYCYNAEYLFFPFCETRSVGEMLAFHTEERRDAMLSYVIDLYAADLSTHPDAVSLESAHLDRSGYYALARQDPARNNHPKERQLDFYGGLRWRFEEHVPQARRKIDRISLFRAKPGLRMLPGYFFNDEEYNTYSCPWHHNLTVAVCSFRTAKALRRNPGSRFDIHSFQWHNSEGFEWHSRQLLDLGLMETGQWF